MSPTIAPDTTWWHQYPEMIECNLLFLILALEILDSQRSSANPQVQYFFHDYLFPELSHLLLSFSVKNLTTRR